MITFDNVTKVYNTNIGLENASIHINKGDFVFLVGPSGAGKSTFIKLILKEINADSGSILVDGQEVTTLSNREIPGLRRKIGIVFQDFRLLPKKTVYENVAFAMEILHRPKRQIRKKVPQVLSLVGISDKADKYPDELSAGEQQRVAIARAIINNPTVLIADEPTGNLDPDTAAEIMELLNQINMTGTTIVMVTHAKDIVDRMQKRVVAIEAGHIVRDEFGQYGFEEEATDGACLDGEVFGAEALTDDAPNYGLSDDRILQEMEVLFAERKNREAQACELPEETVEAPAQDIVTAEEPAVEIEEEMAQEAPFSEVFPSDELVDSAEPSVSEELDFSDLEDTAYRTVRFKTAEYEMMHHGAEAESFTEEEGVGNEPDLL